MIFSSPDPAADPYVVDTVLALQRSAYAVEARLVGRDDLPPLLEGHHDLAAWHGRWILAWEGVILVGAIAWSEHDDHVDLEKLMVSPQAMRRGIGTALVGRMLEAAPTRSVVVSTGRDNAPARSLYARHGFAHEADEHVPPGLWLTRLRLAR